MVFFLVSSAAYTSYSDSHLDCMVVHGGGSSAGGGGDGGGCTGGCCPCSTGTYSMLELHFVTCTVWWRWWWWWPVLVVEAVVGLVGADKVKQKKEELVK